MNETRLTEAERIFAAAADLDEAERTAFLDTQCGGDAGLRADVERLLDSAAASEAYFGGLSGRLGIDRLKHGTAYEAKAGQEFGRYRLTRPLGSGGMGAVWCAERADGRFEGQVAVKLLTRTGNSAALERFNREARYLARFTHPNIARLMDAGVGPDDVPYLILEYVDGVPIDAWCNARSLRIGERLALFIRVIDAVAHAHTRLIVHSDIKPSNVLVTDDGTVKLLDFGIATLLHSDDGPQAGRALTPEYASPEQFAGERISTASDVYSLGLLLYHLLTGSGPRRLGDAASLEELQREATKHPPPLATTLSATRAPSGPELTQLAKERGSSPGRLLKTLRGELDPVVRKALAVDPDDRYANVSDFAADLRRYLGNEPVSALPNTFNYRSRKFVQRHRGSVLTAGLTVLVLIAATVVTAWQATEARRQRDLAIQQQERAMATNEFLNALLGELGPTGETPSLPELLERGVTIIETQFGDNSRTTAQTYFELAVLYGRLGMLDKQIALLDRSEAVALNAGDDGLRARALCAKARLNVEQDPSAAAAALAAGNEALARLPRSTRSAIPECYRATALTHASRGDHEAAIAVYREIVEIMEKARVSSPVLRLQFLSDLGEQYYITGRAGEALGILEKTIDYHEKIGRGNTLTHLIFMANRGAVLLRLGEVARSAEQQGEVMERVAGMPQAPIGFGGLYAASLARLGRYDEAIELLERDYAAAGEARNERRRGLSALGLGESLLGADRNADAGGYLDVADEVFSAAPGAYEREVVKLALVRADAARRRGDLSAAQRDVAGVLARLGYPDDPDGIGLSIALWYATEFALEAGEPAEALAYADPQLELATREARDPELSADVGRALYQRARARLALRRSSDAVADLRRAVISLRNGLGEAHTETVAATALLAKLTGPT